MIVKNPINLIGDALGTFPVLQQLNKDNESFSVIVDDEIKWLYELVPEIKLCGCNSFDKELNLSGAFTMSHQHGCYMSQAHYPFMGYPIPPEPVKAKLSVKDLTNKDTIFYDYIFAPFGRSAPNEQKWSIENWIKLGQLLSPAKILIIGNSNHDKNEFERYFIPSNIDIQYDLGAHQLCNILLNSVNGCISIVTGISHLCFHLGVKNYLLINQNMTWGRNPDAICIEENIVTLNPKTIYDILSSER